MTVSLITFIAIGLFTVMHFIADFPMQSREMAVNKSKKFSVLRDHIWDHWLFNMVPIFTIFFLVHAAVWPAILASLAICIAHGVIDWNIWRLYKWTVVKRKVAGGMAASSPVLLETLEKEFKFWEDPWFYNTIGLDQFLHLSSIVLACILLI